jgi:hypothetical protein
MSKSSILAVVVVAALAAGTVLVAGYVDGPNPGAQVAADSRCGGCPKAGSEACCKVGDACEKAETCPIAAQQSTCDAQPAAGCCPKAQPASCPGTSCELPVQSPCGAGGCAQPK